MPVRPRTAPEPLSTESQSGKPISLLRQDAFPDLERGRLPDKGTFGENKIFTRGLFHKGKGASLALDAYMHKNQEPSPRGPAEDSAHVDDRSHGVFHAHAHDMQYLEDWLGEMLDLKRQDTAKTTSRGPSQPSITPEDPAHVKSLMRLYTEKALRYSVVFDELIRQVSVHSKDLARLVEKAHRGHDTLLTRLIRVQEKRESEVQGLEAQLRELTGASNRKLHEENALMEEQQFAENLTKAELIESRAFCSSLRVKLRYYGEEVARLRQVVLEKVSEEDEELGTVVRPMRVHNSLTSDGVSTPVYAKASKLEMRGRQPKKKEAQGIPEANPHAGTVVTVLSLCTEKADMHARHEREMARLLSQLSVEDSKQAKDIDALSRLVEGAKFEGFMKGISKEGKKAAKRSRETQTKPFAGQGQGEARPGTGPGGKKKPPKKTKGSKSEILPLDLRNSIGLASVPKKVPTLGYMLRTVLDLLLVWSRSMDTVYSVCDKPGGMTEIAIKHFQLLHGMESTTNTMLAQFAAGLVHFADYKRCKVLGDLLGMDDVTKPPPLDHHAALFCFRFLAGLRSVGVFGEEILRERIVKILLNKSKVARAARSVFGPVLPSGSPPVTTLIPCLQDSNAQSGKRNDIGERGKRAGNSSSEIPLAKQMVEFDELLPEVMIAWGKVMKHRTSHVHLAFDHYCSTFQVTEEMRFATDEAPKGRDAVIMQLSKDLVQRRARRELYAPIGSEEGEGAIGLSDEAERGEGDGIADTLGSSVGVQQGAMDWVMGSTGDATCIKDFASMHAPVAELLSFEDLALAATYLNPALTEAEVQDLYEEGCRIMWGRTHTLFRGLWVQEETEVGKKYWVHTIVDRTQWATPFNINDFKRQEIDRQAFVELCLSRQVLDDSPLARRFLKAPQDLWDGWDNIVATLGNKEKKRLEQSGNSKRPSMAPVRYSDRAGA